MNLTAIIPLLKLLKDAGAEVSPIGPPAPDVPEPTEIPTDVEFKPVCGPGRFAYKDPLSGLWSCLVIPKGR
jgi:hypothetical protein